MPTTPRSPRHETGALLRAHLSAATRYGHAILRCPVCHRLQRLAMEPAQERSGPAPEPLPRDPGRTVEPVEPAGGPRLEVRPQSRTGALSPPPAAGLGPEPGTGPGGGRGTTAG
ncbi:MAG TPA: DUF6274 family protein [Streptomyces sp.]|nr:DUF6274 family protein [Streptomyces sp.]